MRPEQGTGWLDALVVGLLSSYCVVIWLCLSRFTYGASHVLLGVGLFASLCACLHFAARGATSFRPTWGALLSLALGAVLMWHTREQVREPETLVGCVLVVLVLGGLHFAVCIASPQARVLRSVWIASSSFLAFWALILVALTGEVTRWHLLRHMMALGSPVYYMLVTPTNEVANEQWNMLVGRRRANLQASIPPYRVEPRFDPSFVLPPANEESPNLVFVLIDTLRADSLAHHGGRSDWMPGLNDLARDSLVFSDVMANTSWTRPSVASFFTGRLQERHGASDHRRVLPEDQLTLAERLREAGYRTAGFAANFAHIAVATGFSQGFEHFEEIRETGVPYVRAEGVNARVIGWLDEKEVDAAAPLFIYVHYMDPHEPYLNGGKPSFPRRVGREPYKFELRYVDEQVTDLLDAMFSRLQRPTIYFVTSDHGEEHGEHDGIGHGTSLYWEQTRIPAILGLPSGARGVLSQRLEGRDFHDLLLALLADPVLDVESWAKEASRPVRYAAVYRTPKVVLHRPFLTQIFMRAVETESHLFVWSAYGSTRELYDLRNDGEQRSNVVGEHPEVVSRMEPLLGLPLAKGIALESELIRDEARTEQLRALGYIE